VRPLRREKNVNTPKIGRRFDMRYMLAGWDLKELFLGSAPNFLYHNYKVIL
jgi:hypothetical protein